MEIKLSWRTFNMFYVNKMTCAMCNIQSVIYLFKNSIFGNMYYISLLKSQKIFTVYLCKRW